MRTRLLSFLLLILGASSSVYAAKFDMMVGFFTIDAKSDSGETSVSGLGSYRAAFSKSVWDQFDLQVGYTLNMTNTIGGDLAYGIDIGTNYFPLTFSEEKNFDKDGVMVRRSELLRPYIGLSFNQRQFQSVRNSYAGFGVNLGSEYSLSKKFSLKSEVRFISLGGSGNSEASELDFLFGISVSI